MAAVQVSLSSLNRHAVATRADVGTSKAECLRVRLLPVGLHLKMLACFSWIGPAIHMHTRFTEEYASSHTAQARPRAALLPATGSGQRQAICLH